MNITNVLLLLYQFSATTVLVKVYLYFLYNAQFLGVKKKTFLALLRTTAKKQPLVSSCLSFYYSVRPSVRWRATTRLPVEGFW